MPADPERFSLSAKTGPNEAGMRLDQAAAALFPDFSRARLQKWIRDGSLTVDGRSARPTYRVGGSEVLRLEAAVEGQGVVRPQDIPLDVIHADEDLLVLNKPAGLVVHPAAGHPDGTLQNALLFHDSRQDRLPRGGIVHRLDMDTSGVMVVARSLRAHSSLVEQLQERKMSRVYRAVAAGVVGRGGSVNAPIGRHPQNRKKMAVVPSGKSAVSHYRVLEDLAVATYLEVSLETGRTHQIRVHMAHAGHPLVGDKVYGRSLKPGKAISETAREAIACFPRQALHAHRLILAHPATGREMRFDAPLPADFEGLLAALREACR